MKPTIPEVFGRFAAYQARPENGAWGSLHVVLEDGNVGDKSVDFCLSFAAERGDPEGVALAGILRKMSPTQRGRLARLVGRKVLPQWNKN